MKYGVIYYKDTDNIGDDIQSYAAMQFLPHLDYLIDRERLDEKLNEPVAVIMNGWYLYKKYNWPPSDNLLPLCVAMHFTANDHWGIGYKYLDGFGGKYLKKYEPIGCRDDSTKKILTEKGIQNYFSGCVTLTLKPRKKIKKEKQYVCVVDVPEVIVSKVRIESASEGTDVKEVTHWVDYYENVLSWEERIDRVEKLLDIYQNAKCVITKRLHCALPCLALGTPVLLIYDEKEDDVVRFSNYVGLLHVSSVDDFIAGKGGFLITNPPPNKEKHQEYAAELTQKIEAFVRDCEENSKEKDSHSLEDSVRITWRNQLLESAVDFSSKEIERLLRREAEQAIERDKAILKLSEELNAHIQAKDQVIEEKDLQISGRDEVIEEKDLQISGRDQVIEEKDLQIRNQKDQLENLNEKLTVLEKNTQMLLKQRGVRMWGAWTAFKKISFKEKVSIIVYAISLKKLGNISPEYYENNPVNNFNKR